MLHNADKDHYWQSVEAALEILAPDGPRNGALELRARLERIGGDLEELFYHAEPLNVARDLAGIDVCTDDHVARYVERVSSQLIE